MRLELGLKPQPKVPFHLTIGNIKNVDAKKVAPLPFKTYPWERPEIVDVIWKERQRKGKD